MPELRRASGGSHRNFCIPIIRFNSQEKNRHVPESRQMVLAAASPGRSRFAHVRASRNFIACERENWTFNAAFRSSSRCRRVYPDSIGTRLIDGNWYVCDYVVVAFNAPEGMKFDARPAGACLGAACPALGRRSRSGQRWRRRQTRLRSYAARGR
jgi:hypothetical protein